MLLHRHSRKEQKLCRYCDGHNMSRKKYFSTTLEKKGPLEFHKVSTWCNVGSLENFLSINCNSIDMANQLWNEKWFNNLHACFETKCLFSFWLFHFASSLWADRFFFSQPTHCSSLFVAAAAWRQLTPLRDLFSFFANYFIGCQDDERHVSSVQAVCYSLWLTAPASPADQQRGGQVHLVSA